MYSLCTESVGYNLLNKKQMLAGVPDCYMCLSLPFYGMKFYLRGVRDLPTVGPGSTCSANIDCPLSSE